MKKMNVRKIFLMIVDALIIALAALVTNAILSLYGIIAYRNTMGVAIQPIRIFIIIALNILFCYFLLFVFGQYNKVWRDLKTADYLLCASAILLGLALSYTFAYFMNVSVTRDFMLLNPLITLLSVILFRVLMKRTVVELL